MLEWLGLTLGQALATVAFSFFIATLSLALSDGADK